ncbi:MAG: DUF29 domain-containing protein [Cyanothece sp. SIO2G6]|nr:DUF29 domain-containing protein [Cyanothece sp. SIO2G6]
MVTNIGKRSLYEQDFLLWLEDTAIKLKARDFENLDLENLIEEVESLGRSERRELSSRLTRLLEHLLKRLYVNLPQNYRGWENTIRNQRTELELLLQDSPSLKSIWSERFEQAWKMALKNVGEEYKNYVFPDRWPYESDIESILERDFWKE